MPADRRVLAPLAVLVLGVAVSACATGERPSFDTTPDGDSAAITTTSTPTLEAPSPNTEDNAGGTDDLVAEYVHWFDTSAPVQETAVYSVLQTSQQVSATITLSRDGDRTVVAARGIQFRQIGGVQTTCDVAAGTCEPGYREQALSDLQLTAGFWGPDVAPKLTSPTNNRRIGPIVSSTTTVAGQQAVCIEIPGPNHTDRYCALRSGTLAVMDTAYVRVELTEYGTTFDESVWAEVTVP